MPFFLQLFPITVTKWTVLCVIVLAVGGVLPPPEHRGHGLHSCGFERVLFCFVGSEILANKAAFWSFCIDGTRNSDSQAVTILSCSRGSLQTFKVECYSLPNRYWFVLFVIYKLHFGQRCCLHTFPKFPVNTRRYRPLICRCKTNGTIVEHFFPPHF